MGNVTAWASEGGVEVTGYNVELRKRESYPPPETRKHVPGALITYINGCKKNAYVPWSCAEPDALTRLIEKRGSSIRWSDVRISNPREDTYTVMTPCENCMGWLTEMSISGSERIYRLNDDLLELLEGTKKPSQVPMNFVNPNPTPTKFAQGSLWQGGPPKK